MKRLRFGIIVITLLWGLEGIFAQTAQDEFETFEECVNAYAQKKYAIHKAPRNNQYNINFPDGVKIIKENLKGDYVVLQPTKHGEKFTILDSTIAVRRRAGESQPFAVHSCNNPILGIWPLGWVTAQPQTFERLPLDLQIPPLTYVTTPIKTLMTVVIPANIFPSKSFLEKLGKLPWWAIPIAIGVGTLVYLLVSSSEDKEKECPKPELDCP